MLNRITLIGRVGKTPDYKILPSGSSVCRVSLATSEIYKDDNGVKKTKTEWHTLIFWGQQADVVHNLVTPGTKLFVDGKLSYRTYVDKESITRQNAEIHVHSFELLSKPNSSSFKPDLPVNFDSSNEIDTSPL